MHGDRRPLALVERPFELPERRFKSGSLAERGGIPTHVAEPPHDIDELLVAELKGRRSEEEHPVELPRQRSVASLQVAFGRQRLELLGELGVGILEVVGFIHHQQW